MKRATEALVHEAQTRTRDTQGNENQDGVDAAAADAASVNVSGSKMVSGMAQVHKLRSSVHFTRTGY